MSLVLALLGALRAALRTRTDLTLENLALRQQLALLRRRSKRPQFARLDRLLWVWLSNHWAGWREALHLVRPETVIRWHRQGFRAFWTWKSRRGRTGRPSVGSELANLVRTLALANQLWDADRRGSHGITLPLAEPLRGASDRHHPPRVARPRDRLERGTSPSSFAPLPPLLPLLSDASRARQGCARAARRRATRARPRRCAVPGRRTPPPLRPPRSIAGADDSPASSRRSQRRSALAPT